MNGTRGSAWRGAPWVVQPAEQAPRRARRLSTNLIIYMTRVMHYSPAFASAQLTLFEGTAYLTPILGAWLADAAWGRFKTILVFSIIYMVVRPRRRRLE